MNRIASAYARAIEFELRVRSGLEKLRQQPPVVEVTPWVEITPVVGSDRAQSTAEHPGATEDEPNQASPGTKVQDGAGAGQNPV